MSRSIVNVAEMTRACKRLLARLPDECESGNQSVVFTARHDSLCIQVGSSSEIISAVVMQTGKESVESPLFSGMVQTLRFYHKKKVEIAVSNNELKIERMIIRPSTHDVSHDEQ